MFIIILSLFFGFFFYFLFFFNDTATTEIYTLSLHDALPILIAGAIAVVAVQDVEIGRIAGPQGDPRSEEHTSELQSRSDLVCRLLLEKKKKQTIHLAYAKKKQPISIS